MFIVVKLFLVKGNIGFLVVMSFFLFDVVGMLIVYCGYIFVYVVFDFGYFIFGGVFFIDGLIFLCLDFIVKFGEFSKIVV